MNLAFLHVGDDFRFVRIMLDSVMRHCEPQSILHLTDEQTRSIAGTQTVRLHYDPPHLMQFKLQHLAALPSMNLLVLDTDVLVQRDLRPIFQFDFDVALTRRDERIPDVNGVDVTSVMPYNTGVMFSRNCSFWHECARFINMQESVIRRWYGDQHAVAYISPYFRLLELSCKNFNYSPNSSEENTDHRYVLHYKGKRKQWMLDKCQVDAHVAK